VRRAVAGRRWRHADDDPVIDLDHTYSRLARTWSEDELEGRYRDAERRGAAPQEDAPPEPIGALPLVASAIPSAATTSVAIHVLHALPDNAPMELRQQLLRTASGNTASALHRCHLALEQDGAAHGYRADKWLPVISDVARSLLNSPSATRDPPMVVEQAQRTITWLSLAVVQLHEDSADTATSMSEALARLLVVSIFAELLRNPAAWP
jgi:hypothetical protein